MQILIVGIGALGGTIAARAIRTGLPVRLAARNTDSAEALRRSGSIGFHLSNCGLNIAPSAQGRVTAATERASSAQPHPKCHSL
jgi:ketopantoate reductase